MRISLRPCLIAVLLLAIVAVGCGRMAGSNTDPKKEQAIVKPQSTPLEIARELLSNKPDLARCRESIKLLNAHLVKNADVRMKVANHDVNAKILRDKYHLAETEIDYLKDITFTGVDAYYLQFCFQMRRVAEALRLAQAPPLVRAKRGFAWSMRQVALQPSGGTILPPAFVLRRGKGSAEERALVFLSLMQQVGLTGGMVAVPGDGGKQTRYLLAGVLVTDEETKQPALYLFDPRLGLPVPGSSAGTVATLEQLQRQPKILRQFDIAGRPYDIKAEQAKKAQVVLACPLSSLSSRMHFLDGELKRSTSIRLALSAEDRLSQMRTVAGDVGVWNSPAKGGRLPDSPLRALRSMLPAEEGGAGSGQGPAALSSAAFAYSSVLFRLGALGVYSELPLDYQKRLDKIVFALFSKYVDSPHQHLLDGRWGREFSQPLVRLGKALRYHRRSRMQNEAQRKKEIAGWVELAKSAYLAELEKLPGAKKKADAVWAMDHYLQQLLLPGQKEDLFQGNVPESPLTYVLLEAADQPLTKQRMHLMALCWLEKAERTQMELELLQAKNKRVPDWRRQDAASNWANAVGSAVAPGESRQFTRQYPVTRSEIASRLALSRVPSPQILVGLLEELIDDIHRTVAIRLHVGDGLARTGKAAEARDVWQKLQEDVRSVVENDELRKPITGLTKAIADKLADIPAQQDLQTQRQLNFLKDLQARLLALTATLDDNGSLSWYAHAAALRLKHGKKVLP